MLAEKSRYKLNKMNRVAMNERLGDAINYQYYDSTATTGGAAIETVVVTGLAAADTVLAVSAKVSGANAAGLVAFSAPGAGYLDVRFTTNPGAGAVVRVLVLKAAQTDLY